MPFHIPDLSYSPGSLEPVLSKVSVEFHREKHKGYLEVLNKLVDGTEWSRKSLEELIVFTHGSIFNHAAQVWNHNFLWESLSPRKIDPAGLESFRIIERDFGSIENLKREFIQSIVTLFGSGWIWLVKDKNGVMSIMQGSNAWNPLRVGKIPLLAVDAWEHAYYMDYPNRRFEYAAKIIEILDWEKMEKRYYNQENHVLSKADYN